MQDLCFCYHFSGDDRYIASVFPTYLELYSSVNQGIQRMVTAHADVFTRVEFCTSLTYDDIACLASLTTENLHT